MTDRTFIFGGLVFATYCWIGASLPAADTDELFWSFRPVRATVPPVVVKQESPQSTIDSFILARLEEQHLGPSSLAGKQTLIRRATFDLTGLPPTPEEIDEFLADAAPDAFSRVVDRLLASPRYGERWARHWLDVVRYADARDLIQLPVESDFREAWRYRDWVVNALNRDMPYSDFVTRQIAGDLLQPADASQIDADALVATGMLAIADFVPGDVDKQQMIADYVNDQIDVVGRAILGLTLACARCHDHKFDAISTEDYYALAGIFFSTRLVPGPIKGNTPLVRVPLLPAAQIAARDAEQARDKAWLAELSRDVATLADREYRAYLERRVAQDTSKYLLAAWEFRHVAAGDARSMLADFANARSLDAEPLRQWIRYIEEPRPHPALEGIRNATDLEEAKLQVQALTAKLADAAANRPAGQNMGSGSRIAETEVFRFRANDRRLVTNESGQVTGWPNRGRGTSSAAVAPDAAPPTVVSMVLHGKSCNVIRFSGQQMLQVAGSVPPAGSLLVVYRPDPQGGAGQRLVGWEDSSVGQHGLGIMTDGAGAIHAVLRRNGMSGDVNVAASGAAPDDFQILSVTWGPAGVTVHRNSQPVGANKGIDSVSSDPAITALRIGGPGSGGSPRFQGDVAELRVYAMPFDDADRTRLETELAGRWRNGPGNTDSLDIARDLYDELTSSFGPFQLEGAERERILTEDFRQRLAGLREELETLKKKPAPAEIPRAVVVQDGGPPGTPHEGFHDAAVYLRGDHSKPGKTVSRGVPRAIAGGEPLVIPSGSGRRELAKWLTHPANPLTARVMVNRIWQHHFGTGLVRTSANFGEMGERPTHPDLLDYLAARFVSSGWSVKSMHRLMMLSSTYQQTSQTESASCTKRGSGNGKGSDPVFVQTASDPENRLLWRANRRRLEAEELRDSLLTIADRLDETPGGPGFQEVSKPRRSLYLMAVRTGAKTAEFGPLFDAADCTGIVERRNESIVAPQALFLMNDPLIQELATVLAERITREVPAARLQDRISRLYRIALGRLPVDEEMAVGLKFLNDGTAADAEWARYCHLIICTNEFVYVD